MELRYIRDRSSREVDFVVIKDGNPLFAVECNANNTSLDPSIKYFEERLKEIPKFYQVHLGNEVFLVSSKTCILHFSKLYQELNLP